MLYKIKCKCIVQVLLFSGRFFPLQKHCRCQQDLKRARSPPGAVSLGDGDLFPRRIVATIKISNKKNNIGAL